MLIDRVNLYDRFRAALENLFDLPTDRRGRLLLFRAKTVAEKKSQRDEKLTEER